MNIFTETAVEPSPVGLIGSSVGGNKESDLRSLVALLSESEVIALDDAAYEAASKTWSAGRNLHPKLVVRPQTTKALSDVLKFLANSSLNFNIYNRYVDLITRILLHC
jgi:hypothetical protein